ncbi:ABC-type antimicrobial peptide transport system, ATPase component [Clostridium pasteurianum DSM 525 = ATCC 6013]|uniref:ABC-type antimicrobial peptide transport system, ATPase component n=1 Tax=Clostridium pasteurianum DSM 525 = ATCC 6013 TaxID=1262449 RepID=A0A0H3JAT0_CLOPA|nr:ABC transporter ATP-binding protein [Clostridium pasteurianum]AJA49813.1 ABC-type antimicrobial peptide transport system, ATPase component [Clostridium pasteurianum DSM 525 = ATCC 6013]AJA53801.1 ABC-type antimicrobial peptide transport system, ATPase component [Clostridium pasteurianum DSM 525 = ATCC 6013]AOZ76960.1 peptide ABC transporter ATP-binding protein [Clostridium pasteurianum DSM 525 = ATCC 6013]AOZ80757.1 peptide ABC transporter ATP-binding protein [Clostridium pasteurianum]ELP57
MQQLLKIKGLSKWYKQGKDHYDVLNKLDFSVEQGSFVIIMGKSGSGKTTLLNTIGLLDEFNEGSYDFKGQDVTKLKEVDRSVFRNNHIGFIFQQFHLIESLTIAQNIELPLLYHGGYTRSKRIEMIKKSLKDVGLEEKFKNYPNELSGGQQQRISIARALVTQSDLILADEPTGALDWKTGLQIIDLLVDLNKQNKTIIMVTHDEDLRKYATRCVYLKDGAFCKEDEI